MLRASSSSAGGGGGTTGRGRAGRTGRASRHGLSWGEYCQSRLQFSRRLSTVQSRCAAAQCQQTVPVECREHLNPYKGRRANCSIIRPYTQKVAQRLCGRLKVTQTTRRPQSYFNLSHLRAMTGHSGGRSDGNALRTALLVTSVPGQEVDLCGSRLRVRDGIQLEPTIKRDAARALSVQLLNQHTLSDAAAGD